MTKHAFAALLMATLATLGISAHAQTGAATTAPAPAAAAPVPLTPEQITAYNTAITDFTQGQALQQANNNAGALAKYEAALPAIRAVVLADPTKIDNVAFLANALYASAAAQAALGNIEGVLASYQEAAPHWRTVSTAKPDDMVSRNVLAGILVQMGNAALGKQDKGTADPYYAEAATLARKSVAAEPTDTRNRNLLLAALIGRSQTSEDKAIRVEAIAMGKAMLADGSVDAINRPSVEIMTGATTAPAI